MALSLNGTTGISGINGSAGTPALQGGDADTGIFFGTDTASIATAGANRLHVTSTGLIGVGTSSPAGGFHVDAASGVDGPVFDSGGAANANHALLVRDSSNNQLLRVNNNGKIGVGTANPAANLEITPGTGAGTLLLNNASGSTADGALNIEVNSGGVLYESRKTGGLAHIWYAAGAEKMRILPGGGLLVGTSSSSDTLGFAPNFQVEGTSATTSSGSFLRTSSDNNPAYLGLCKKRGSGNVANGDNIGRLSFTGFDGVNFLEAASISCFVDGAVNTQGDMPGRLVFSVTQDGSNTPSERMRFDDEGIIYHNSSNHGIGTFLTQSAGTVKYAFRAHYGSPSGNYGGTECFTVWSNGNVVNTNNSYGPISDVKLKENIVDANSQWDDLKALRVVNFNFKQETGYETHKQLGFIAQEVEQVSPGLVYDTPDHDEEGNDLSTVTKVMQTSVLYTKAVKALQEAMERIETLEAKVAALEAQ